MRIMVAVLMGCLLGLPTARAQLAPRYDVTRIAPLPGDVGSIAYGVNDLGVVVGVSRDAGGNNTLAGFRWQAGSTLDLGLYPAHTAVRPWGINNLGHVAGRATNGPGGSNYGVYHDGTGWQLAGWVGGTRGNGFGINDANQVVGNMRLPSGDFSRAYVWTPGSGTLELPTIHPADPANTIPDYGGYEGGSYANAINRAGVVVGSSGLSDTHGTDRAFRWTPEAGMTDLGTPASQGLSGLASYTSSYAQNLSDAGTIVGAADRGPGLSRAVYWDVAGVIHDIGTLGGDSGWAYAINEAGVVVGASANGQAQSRAFGWFDSELVDLNTRIDPLSGWTLLRANDINESGWIVGEGLWNGTSQAFLLTPVPEPEAWATILVGLGLLFWQTRRRARLLAFGRLS